MDDLPRDRLMLGAAILAITCASLVAGTVLVVLGSSAFPKLRNKAPPYQVATPVVTPAQVPVVDDHLSPVADTQDRATVPSEAPVGTPHAAESPSGTPAPADRLASDQGIPPLETPGQLETSTVQITSSTITRNARPRRKSSGDTQTRRGLEILQIGDSHTSADFFSGDLRRLLQQRYGNGGAGYITAGHPHIGVRSSALKVTASSGWTYKGIQKSESPSEFWLSGFNALASEPGETLTFTAESPFVFDSIEIEAQRRPGGGAIGISLDGVVQATFDLDAKAVEPLVMRLSPDGIPKDRVRQIEIRTTKDGAVSIASVAVYNKQSGVSYNSVGYPGATVDLLNKFDQTLFADGLRRLNPQIVVLSFGTNEASKEDLDPDRYRRNFEKAINKIVSVLPDAKIVLIGPPDGAERASHCAKPSLDAACHSLPRADMPSGELAPAGTRPPDGATPVSSKTDECDWHPLPKLELVRTIERNIAEQRGFTFWNWASIMPAKCGSHIWATANPPLMMPDHVHFTIAGYNKGAEQFLTVLIPVIEKLQVRPNITADN